MKNLRWLQFAVPISILANLVTMSALGNITPTLGERSCGPLFGAGFSFDKSYQVHFRGDNMAYQMVYKGAVIIEGKSLYEFLEKKQNFVIRASPEQIIQAREIKPGSEAQKIIETGLENGLNILVGAHAAAQLRYKPLKQLAKIEVPGRQVDFYGTFLTSKKTGIKMATQLSDFDLRMQKMGFKIPPYSRIVISDNPILPSLIGPFSISFPTKNIWFHSEESPAISMSPFIFEKKYSTSDAILFHERAHASYHETYSDKAFINANKIVQEALADFAAANMTGSPGIAKFDPSLPAMRDIKSRRTEDGGRRLSILDAQESSYHNDSMLVSGLLWKIRENIFAELGQEKFDIFFHSLVEGLNRYNLSYETYAKKWDIDETSNHTESTAKLMNYILSVALKVNNEQSLGLLKGKVEKAIFEYATELKLSPKKIQEATGHLALSQKNFEKENKIKSLKDKVSFHVFSTFGLLIDSVVGAAALYMIF